MSGVREWWVLGMFWFYAVLGLVDGLATALARLGRRESRVRGADGSTA